MEFTIDNEKQEGMKLRIAKYIHLLNEAPFEIDVILQQGLTFAQTLIFSEFKNDLTNAACFELAAELLVSTLNTDFETSKLMAVHEIKKNGLRLQAKEGQEKEKSPEEIPSSE